jgi:hypothetical protein
MYILVYTWVAMLLKHLKHVGVSVYGQPQLIGRGRMHLAVRFAHSRPHVRKPVMRFAHNIGLSPFFERSPPDGTTMPRK